MRNAAPMPAKLLWTIVLTSFLQASIALSEEMPLSSKSSNDNPQLYGDLLKRDWNKELHIWGKRGWNNLHGGWGLKRNAPIWDEIGEYSPPQKRAWQNLQNGWGKRIQPEDEAALIHLTNYFEQEQIDPQVPEYDPEVYLENNDEVKRNWGQFHGGWGKRGKWDKFRGSWGKREPAWSNLKGIWGKRSLSDAQ